MEECTFQPNALKTRSGSSANREQVHSKLATFNKLEVLSKNENAKELRELEQCTFNPSLNQNSVKMIYKDPLVPAHQTLMSY